MTVTTKKAETVGRKARVIRDRPLVYRKRPFRTRSLNLNSIVRTFFCGPFLFPALLRSRNEEFTSNYVFLCVFETMKNVTWEGRVGAAVRIERANFKNAPSQLYRIRRWGRLSSGEGPRERAGSGPHFPASLPSFVYIKGDCRACLAR